MPVQISVTSDFICPWCYIGEKRLARAIERLPSGIEVQLQWLPFELNPDMLPGGIDRKTYLSRKFGSSERVQAIQSQTVLAGRDDGATVDYDAIERTPNTSAGAGFDRNAIAAFLSSEDGVESVRPLERIALDRGIQGVPYFDIGGTAIVGAQPAETILQTIMAAAGRLAPRPAA
jgi:predicted DsbA family dithiol-disulfide isomerase